MSKTNKSMEKLETSTNKSKEELVIPSKIKEEEKLTKELEVVAKEILTRQEEERIIGLTKGLTNPSAIALSTTKHDSGTGINTVKKTPKQLFSLYLTNQFIARAVNIRADTLIAKGYDIIGGDAKGKKACEELIKNSGGTNLFYQLALNTYIAGDGFLEPILNQKRNKMLRLKHVHPLTLEFRKNLQSDRIIVDSLGEPVGYVQYFMDSTGVEQTKDVPKKRIEHLRFNTIGDEFTGISILQPLYDTAVRLMNMEYSAAEAAVKIANPIIIGYCNTKSPHQVSLWGSILGRINGKDQLFVPEGMKIETLQPGQQNFNDYADYFLNAVVAGAGVPKGILLGDSGGSNRAETIVLSRHFYSLIRTDQQYMEEFFNTIFEKYGRLAGFKAPTLGFPDTAETADANAQSAKDLFADGIIDRNEARSMIGLYDLPKNKQDPKEKPIDVEVKNTEKKVYYPAEPGSPEGSEKGVKKKMKSSPYSETKSLK